MSWNARRFGMLVRDSHSDFPDPDPTLMWVPTDTIDRIGHGLDADAFEMSTGTMPTNGVWIGLQSPIRTDNGDVDLLYIYSSMGTLYSYVTSIMEIYGVTFEEAQKAFEKTVKDGTVRPALSVCGFNHGTDLARFSVTMSANVLNWSTEGAVSEKLPYSEINAYVRDGQREEISDGDNAHSLVTFAHAVWTLATSAEERSVHAVTAAQETVSLNKKQRRPSPKTVADVTVLDIRRPHRSLPAVSGGDREPIERNHRWEVRGHYRDQPYGPGRSLRRRKWIAEQVRGPEDKPLIRKQRVYRVR